MDPSYINPSSPAPSPAPIISSGVPAPSPVTPQKSKKPLIITLIILAAATIITLTIIALSSNIQSSSKISEVITFIRNGDSATEYSVLKSDDESDFQLNDTIMAIRISESNNITEISKYYSSLNSKIAELKQEDLSNNAKILSDLTTILDKTINYRFNLQEIQKVYSEKGYDPAVEQIQSFAITNDNSILQIFSNKYTEYYKSSIAEYDLFYQNQCFSGTLYDYSCINDAGLSLEINNLETSISTSLNFLTNPDSLKALNYAVQQQITTLKEGK